MRCPRARWSRLLLGLVGAAAVVVAPGPLQANPAAAHTVLLRMEPADGAVLVSPPEEVRLVFSEAVSSRFAQVAVVVTAPDGRRVEAGEPRVADTTVTVPLQPLTVPGRYTVAYRVTSADSHPVSQQLAFTTLDPRGTASSSPAAAPLEDPAQASAPADQARGAVGGHLEHVLPAAVVGVGAVGAGLAAVRRRRRRAPHRSP